MIVTHLALTHFRSFTNFSLTVHPEATFIIGPNAVGKTNILESLMVLFQGAGLKEERSGECLQFGSDQTKVVATLDDEGISSEMATIWIKKDDLVMKKWFVDRIPRSWAHYRQEAPPLVVFAPQLIEEITRSPSRRRSLLDRILSSHDNTYRKHLTNYSSGLFRRNKLLEKQQLPEASLRKELEFWDSYIVEHGTYLQDKRREFCNSCNQNISHVFPINPYSIIYHPKRITKEALEATLPEQLRYRTTTIGPQRDDIDIMLEGRSVLRFGSRSQQRLALLWINMNEITCYTESTKKPILLLDDLFSELDEHYKELVLQAISGYQTLFTSPDASICDRMHTDFGKVELAVRS
ncbi:MAG: DNA replication and repair protein RecF [Microgenomates bacterium OLB22]|nr:MAG: DNA replication and repair protein RecF [Microgenomates bacterium OLB22]